MTAALVAALALSVGPATAAMVVYDDFNGTEVDTAKWNWTPVDPAGYYGHPDGTYGPKMVSGAAQFPGTIDSNDIQ